MSSSATAELRLSLIARIVACDDLLRLRTVQAVFDEAPETSPASTRVTYPNSLAEPGARPASRTADLDNARSPAPAAGGGLLDGEEVVGYRPDGTPVRPREAVKNWDDAVADVLAGNGMSVAQVKARVRDRVHGK